MRIKKVISSLIFVLTFASLCPQPAHGQIKKGDKEVLVFSSGFNAGFGGGSRPRDLTDSGSFVSSITSVGFNLGGEAGYFITRHHEVGAGLHLSASWFKFCVKDFSDGQITGEQCDSDSNVGLGLSGFYRYNFARADARGFPFVGGSLLVTDVTTNFRGNISARPHAGYKYFVKRNVALDFSAGYLIELNKDQRDDSFFIINRRHGIDGRIGLSFVF